MEMTDREKIKKMWSALNHVVDYIEDLNSENPEHTIVELFDIGFNESWIRAFGFADEDIDYGLAEWKEENGLN